MEGGRKGESERECCDVCVCASVYVHVRVCVLDQACQCKALSPGRPLLEKERNRMMEEKRMAARLCMHT